MGTNVSETSYRALIIPDSRAVLLDAESSYSEASPRVDSPTRESGETALTLSATAESIATAQESKTLRVRINRSGMAATAGFVWRQEADDADECRGWNPPNVPMSWTSLTWTDGSGSPFEITDPNAITLDDESVVLAFERKLSTTREVVVRKYTPSTDAWSSAVVVFSIANTTATLRPCLVKLPSGRLLLYLWIVGSTEANIRMYYSVNDGVSWDLGVNGVLTTPIGVSGATADYSVAAMGRLRAVYVDGTISMVASIRSNDTSKTVRDVLVQWVSSDLGSTFSQVGSIWAGAASVTNGDGAYHDLQSVGGQLALLFISNIGGNHPEIRKVASPYTELRTAAAVQINSGTWATLASKLFTDGDLASWVDSTGAVYCIGRRAANNQEIIGFVSTDKGATWNPLGESSLTAGDDVVGEIVETGVTTSYPRKLTATGQGARGLLFHSWEANVGNEEDSLAVLALGGFSSLTMPSLDNTKNEDKSVGYSISYYPFDIPSDTGWTAGGTGTAALTSARLDLPTGGGARAKHFRKSNSDAIANGIIFNIALKANAGGSVGAAQIGAQLQLADGSNDYKVELRITTTSFVIYDVHATGNVGATVTTDMTAENEIIIAFEGTALKSWFRVYNSKGDSSWTDGPSGAITSGGATGVSTNTIKFGRLTANATADCEIVFVRYTTGSFTGNSGDRLAGGQTNPDDLRARSFASYVEGGISVSMIDGPAYRDDEHSIAVTHDYALNRCLPDSKILSPRVEWRSQDETEQSIALLTSRVKTEVTDSLADTIGLGLFGINFRSATLEGYNAAGSWVSLFSVDLSPDLDALSWERKGNAVRPNGAASPIIYLFANEFKGSYFKFDGGDCRKIKTNAGGSWSASTTKRRTALSLEDTDGGEGSSGTAGAIWPANAIIVVPLLGVDYAGFRLKITASQGTAEGYYKIGQLVFGPLAIFADQYSFGRSVETQPNTEISTARDGSTRAAVLGPSRRIVEFGWTEGVDSTEFGNQSPDPDYVKSTTAVGALPVATKGETLRTMEGILQETDGGARPVVYIPRAPGNIGTGYQRNRRDELVLARLVSPIRLDAVLGEETVDELTRLSKVTLEEII